MNFLLFAKFPAAFCMSIMCIYLMFYDANNPFRESGAYTQIESFDKFIVQFNADRKFQLSRTKFPLESKVYNTDNGTYNKARITKSDWKYSDFPNRKYVKKITRIRDGYSLNVQIEDTGVHVNYIFKEFSGRWYLISIVDEST